MPNPKTQTELTPSASVRLPCPFCRSYDLDGDGVVDQRDYFYGKLFDKDHNGLLTKEERSKAVKALNNNYSDNFLFGYDTHGVMRPYPETLATKPTNKKYG